MNDSTQTMTRYLLGELPEDERAALEAQYFADPRVFDELTRAEAALVDDFVRGRLPVDMRQRFEQTYLANSRLRDRVKFSEALAETVDRAGAEPSRQDAQSPAAHEFDAGSGWRAWLVAPWGLKPALGFAVALLIASTGVWLAIESSRGRQESAQADARRAEEERRTREAAEQARAAQPQAQPPRAVDQPPPATPPTAQQPRSPSFVVLALAVGVGERSLGASVRPTLVIPPGISDVRLQLTMREHEFASYHVVLRAVAGPEILRRAAIQPIATASGAMITLSVPAGRFTTGDYMLTLHGAASGGELDDLSQSLFRVEKK